MRVAVVHGLLRGGAARRLGGTLTELAAYPDVTQREFFFGEATSLLPRNSMHLPWSPEASRRPRLLRPAWRYRDLVTLRTAWSRLWDEVNAWQPQVVFANPCSVPGGAPPKIHDANVSSLYYCDEPRRVDYEKAAARSSNPITRLPYLPMRRVHRADERASVGAAAAIATNSRYTAGRIEAAYGRPAEVITPGIADIFTAPGADSPPVEPQHVLSVGTLIPSKGHDLVIEAVAASRVNLPVVVVAPRPDDAETARLQGIAERRGVALQIEVGITDEALRTLYGEAYATLYLARDEPLGLVSLESQACGTPVIVAAEGGLPETVEPGVTGLCVERTADAAAAALDQLVDPDRRGAMSQAAWQRPVPRDADSAAQVYAMLTELSVA